PLFLFLGFVSSAQVRARIVRAQPLELLVQLALRRRHVARHHDLHGHQLIAGATALEARHPVARQPERAPARRRGRDLHRDLAAQGRHFQGRAQRGLGCRHREGHVNVVALALEERVGRDRDAQVEIAARSRGAGAFTGDAYALVAFHTGRNLHVDLAAYRLRAAAPARRARPPLDVAGAGAGGARLLEVQGERLACALKRLVERDLETGLHITAAGAPAAALEEVLEPDALAAALAATGHVAEDRAEEV